MLKFVALSAVFAVSIAVPIFEASQFTTWASLSAQSKSLYTFDHFNAEFPEAVNAAEKEYRATVFNANLKKIHDHNSLNLGWTMGVNKFAAMTPAEFKSYYAGRSKSMAAMRDPLAAEPADLSTHVAVEDLPSQVDWRTKNVVTPAKDQGGCGSCWAFSTAETLESHIAIQTGKLLKLAPQQFVSCMPNPLQVRKTPSSLSLMWVGASPLVTAGSFRCSAVAPVAARGPRNGAFPTRTFMCLHPPPRGPIWRLSLPRMLGVIRHYTKVLRR